MCQGRLPVRSMTGADSWSPIWHRCAHPARAVQRRRRARSRSTRQRTQCSCLATQTAAPTSCTSCPRTGALTLDRCAASGVGNLPANDLVTAAQKDGGMSACSTSAGAQVVEGQLHSVYRHDHTLCTDIHRRQSGVWAPRQCSLPATVLQCWIRAPIRSRFATCRTR